MEEVKKRLSQEYRAGRRWLVYDSFKGSDWLKRVHCFAGYAGAAAWCKARSGREGVYRIRVLSDVLAGMNGVRPAEPTASDRQVLRELLGRRPVTAYKDAIPIEWGLLRQKYFPVLWNQWLDPLRAVSTYQLVSRNEIGEGKAKICVRGSFDNFTMAVTAFAATARQRLAAGGEWLLTGELEGDGGLTGEGQFGEREVVVFYRSKPSLPGCSGMTIEQVHDPVERVRIRTPYFVSFDRQHGILRFYDGMLKSVQPGGCRDSMDLGWFDFDCADIFSESV